MKSLERKFCSGVSNQSNALVYGFYERKCSRHYLRIGNVRMRVKAHTIELEEK